MIKPFVPANDGMPADLIGDAVGEVLIPIAQRHRTLVIGERSLRGGLQGHERGENDNRRAERERLQHGGL